MGGSLRARHLRRHTTEAERSLWALLRLLKHQGLHFRRQAPMGPYIVDFACHRAKIIVELDGSGHGEPAQMRHDAERTAFLAARGYRVLRFWNVDIVRNRNRIVDAILASASRPPPETLARFDLPARGR